MPPFSQPPGFHWYPIAYHAHLQVKKIKLHSFVKSRFLQKWVLFREHSRDAQNSIPLESAGPEKPTTSLVEMSSREALLEDQEAGKH